ncbi:MAG TPA: hypothetical protein DCW68_01500 [Rhodospirillaceae bacterium]|nr:MAG: hypothetical protein A2018_04465 [Alphaproteobacteria bacterium GWF2_58_20]HAU28773.1 hypothetical protein [Rhodospirillaceae bacterium]
MRTIHLASTNKGKLASMRKHLDGLDIEVVPVDLPIVEPQASSIEGVAKSKAHQAFNLLKKPVVIEDSGFFINALEGFPGPYAKYINETIKVEGLIKLMDGEADRRCKFIGVLVYIDETGKEHVFSHEERGSMSLAVDNTECAHSWSRLWHIFIPEGNDVTINILKNRKDSAAFDKLHSNSDFCKFATFMRNPSS